MQLNPDIKGTTITEGQLIIVPNKEFKETETQIVTQDYVKDGFIYHKVLPKENYYRLKIKFGASKRVLRKHNPSLGKKGPKAGELIKIPIKRGVKVDLPIKEEVVAIDTKPYLVRPKETKRSIARRYGITVEKLEELNPNLKVEVLKMATIINVPNTKEIPDTVGDFVTYLVKKGETFFSLGKQFKLTQEQLITLNPELKEGVKEGMVISIPKDSYNENKNIFIESIPENIQLQIVMMLPFTGKKGEVDFEKNKTLNRVTDFYLGGLIALDSIKKQGVSVSVNVFDTKSNVAAISTILKNNSFDDVDAIVGPLFLNNVKFVAQRFQNDSMAIVSPVSSKDHSKFASKNIVKEIPSKEHLATKVLEYIKKHYKKQHLIVIGDDKKESFMRINKVVASLNVLDSTQKVTILKPEKGYIKPDLFKKVLKEDKENWIVLATEDDVVTADVINNLGVLPEKIKETLFALNYGSNFEKIKNEYLARVNLHYSTTSFVNFDDKNVQQFIKQYKQVNHIEPSEYAFKGFDIMYDVLVRLASYKTDVEGAFGAGISERASCKFQYIKSKGKGFENKGVFLIKYDGLNLVNVENTTVETSEIQE